MKNKDDNNNIGDGIDDGYIYMHICTHISKSLHCMHQMGPVFLHVDHTPIWETKGFVQVHCPRFASKLLEDYSSFKLFFFFQAKFLHGSSLREAMWPLVLLLPCPELKKMPISEGSGSYLATPGLSPRGKGSFLPTQEFLQGGRTVTRVC